MTNTTIVTTADALSGAADGILKLVAGTDQKISKNAILHVLACEIGGPRQNWGGIKNAGFFAGLGAPQLWKVKSLRSAESSQQQSPTQGEKNIAIWPYWHNRPYDAPEGSEIAVEIEGVPVTARELYNLKRAWDFMRGKQAWDRELTECLYDLIRPWMSGGSNEIFAAFQLPRILQTMTYRENSEEGVHHIMTAWTASRFDSTTFEDARQLEAVLKHIEHLELSDLEGEYFLKNRWHYPFGSKMSP
jgi:hypothetical protein